MAVFSEYEVRQVGFKFDGDNAYTVAECIGSSEETMNTRVISKKCRGVVKKKVVKADGTGVVKYSMHLPWEIYTKLFGMEDETVKDGVKTYGMDSVHGKFSMVVQVFDEDGNEKLKAYPVCVVETGKTTKTENGAEEVAEMELEVAVSPDEYGVGLYETVVSELGTSDATVKSTWMTAFTPALVRKATA